VICISLGAFERLYSTADGSNGSSSKKLMFQPIRLISQTFLNLLHPRWIQRSTGKTHISQELAWPNLGCPDSIHSVDGEQLGNAKSDVYMNCGRAASKSKPLGYLETPCLPYDYNPFSDSQLNWRLENPWERLKGIDLSELWSKSTTGAVFLDTRVIIPEPIGGIFVPGHCAFPCASSALIQGPLSLPFLPEHRSKAIARLFQISQLTTMKSIIFIEFTYSWLHSRWNSWSYPALNPLCVRYTCSTRIIEQAFAI
jgi:hypothetical protein